MKNRDKGENCSQLRKADLGYFCHKLQVGDLVVTGDKSSAADIIVKVGENFIIELQLKTGKQQLNYAKVRREVEKSVVSSCSDFKSIFVLIITCGITYDDTQYKD